MSGQDHQPRVLSADAALAVGVWHNLVFIEQRGAYRLDHVEQQEKMVRALQVIHPSQILVLALTARGVQTDIEVRVAAARSMIGLGTSVRVYVVLEGDSAWRMLVRGALQGFNRILNSIFNVQIYESEAIAVDALFSAVRTRDGASVTRDEMARALAELRRQLAAVPRELP